MKCRYCNNEKENTQFYCKECLEKINKCDKCDPSGNENWHKGKCLECVNNPIRE